MLKIRKISAVILTVILMLACFCPATASAQSSGASDSSSAQTTGLTAQSAQASAKAFVQMLYDGKFDEAAANFDEAVLKTYNAETLKSDWNATIPLLGTNNGITGTQYLEQQGEKIVLVTSSFEYYILTSALMFDDDGKISGFHISYTVNGSLAPKTYNENGFKEIHFNLVSGKFKLPAVLTLPEKTGNTPAVVLVAGSGVQNRDEANSVDKPFKDVAEGLAKQGIASLRFDKRTFAYHSQFLSGSQSVGINEEYTNDATAAFSYLSDYKGINHAKIFLLGHSEGGMLAPRIALSNKKLAGLIIMAGSPRRLEDIYEDQIAEKEPLELTYVMSEVAKIKQLDKMDKAPDETILGAPASYWKDLNSQDAATDALKFSKPILIMQGKRDTQSFMTDFNLWKKKLSAKKNVVYKTYAKLNHLFIEEGSGPVDYANEYSVPGHVASYAIKDIVSFIK